MTIETYYSLVDGICERCGILNPASMYASAGLQVKGVNFSMYYGGAIAPDCALLYSDFGDVPAQAKEMILLRLLELNLYLYSVNTPAFCYNTETGRIVLVCRLPLAGATPEKVLALLAYTADMALEWRRDCRIADNEHKTGLLSNEASPAQKVSRLLEHLAGMTPARGDSADETRIARSRSDGVKNARHLLRTHAAAPSSGAKSA